MRVGSLGLIGTLTFSWSCASSGTRAEAPSCATNLDPDSRSLSEFFDSAAVQRQVAELWPEGSGLVVASISLGEGDAADSVNIWSEYLEGLTRSRLRRVLGTAGSRGTNVNERVYLFVGDERGPAIRRVARLGGCAPVLVQEEETARRISSEVRGLGLEQRRVVRLFVFVQADGRVGEVRVDESSGHSGADAAAARVFRAARFSPARVEGIATSVWIKLPITFTPSEL